ncbi:MAG TPA: ABC transporter permease, partial [Myxococcaceae bacterium]|nr:ABC transporter permease [Myxococcaceae bacterium]
MSFRLHRALAVTWKEALDLRKNPGLLASMLALPAVLVLVPTGVVWAWLRNPDTVTFRSMALYYDPALPLNADPV